MSTAASPTDPRSCGWPGWRIVLGLAVAASMGWASWQLARVDSQVGAPFGPDRIVAAAEASTEAGFASVAPAVLRARPIDGAAYRLLGQAAVVDGEGEHALMLYRIAARRDPRDWRAQLVLADYALAHGEQAEGIGHLDAALRVAPELRGDAFRVLMPSLSNRAVRNAFADALASAPPWEGALLKVLRDPATDAATSESLLAALASRRALTADELSVRVGALTSLGRVMNARQLWVASLNETDRALAGPLFDGGFESVSQSRGDFAWQWSEVPGVSVTYDDVTHAGGRQSLRLDFGGRAIALRGPVQTIALAPGRYTLGASVKDDTDAGRPFAWTIRCASGAALMRAELPRGMSEGWEHIDSVEFDVPADCPRQRIALTYDARSMQDAQISGALWLDNVSLRNLPADASP